MTATIKRNSRDRQPGNMLAVDLRRMFTSRYFYVLLGVALVIPVLILVMTTMMGSGVSVDPSTGAETAAEAFENVWQAIGTLPGAATGGGMSMTSMCNINLVYFF